MAELCEYLHVCGAEVWTEAALAEGRAGAWLRALLKEKVGVPVLMF